MRGEDITSKHAVKQVDRLLSNRDFYAWRLFGAWVPFVMAERTEAVITLDWTDFEKDDLEPLDGKPHHSSWTSDPAGADDAGEIGLRR